jgi:hypothetical protein
MIDDDADRRRVEQAKIAAGDIYSIDAPHADAVVRKLGYSTLSLAGVAVRRVLLTEFAALRQRAIDDKIRDLEETLQRIPDVLHHLAPLITIEEARGLVASVRATVEHHNRVEKR